MFYKKKGKPEVGEIVVCTVQRIVMHSVFVTIDEYRNLDGMVHISEVAPGRIRNLRDYVKEGKRIVCKVLNINKFTGNIDLSLRRVGTSFMIEKLNEIKQEEKAEKLLESIGSQSKTSLEKLYGEFGARAVEKYGSLYKFLQDIVDRGEAPIKEMNVSQKFADILLKIIREKIKPVTKTLSGELKLKSYSPDGINQVKSILKNVEKEGISITYLGAPKYKLEITTYDTKEAGKKLRTAIDSAIARIEHLKGEGEYVKIA